MERLYVTALEGLIEVNVLAGASPREAFVLAFKQLMSASEEELELLGRESTLTETLV